REFVWAGVFDLAGTAPREISTSQAYVNTTDQPLPWLASENWLVDDYFLCAMGTYGTRNESGCLDALNPNAVRAWMSLAYWPYADRFPEDMGKTIRGFFFDEPTMVSAFHTEDVPWTAGLEESFRQRYGYDCRPLLWTLFTQTDGHEQFRYDYWRLVTYLFETSFTGQLSDWCQEHGVILSGHCWPEEPSCQRLMTNSTGDTFSLQRHLQMPGTDFLYCENNYAEKAGMCQDTPGWARNLIYSAKLPSSTARYVNVSQTICESSGASALDPGCTAPAATKKTYDFLYAMGITTMNPAFPLDRTDIRKYVCMLDAGQPYWRHYKLVTDYLNRLGQFNSRGRTDTRIAVLSPLSTRFAFSEITDDTSIRSEKTPLNRKGDCVEPVLATLDALVRAHLDFELLFEDVVLDSPVATSGELLAPNSNFQVIVLPQCYALDDAVWTKLDEFARAGGHLVAVGASPTLPLKHGPQALEVAPLPTVQLNPADADFASQLVSSLKAMSSPAYELQGAHNEEILAQARQDGEWQGIFLANGTPGPKTFTFVGKLAEKLRTLVDPQGDRQEPWTQGQTIT
ncbi:MAG: hypothetical protein J6866_07385, partial [Victivallales bacterium]|nr:hypothetical protein [Victivallales bacterium]